LKQLAKTIDPTKQTVQPTPRRPPQTPARRTPAVARTPGTIKRTPRGTTTVATPHTARAVKQLQLAVGKSGDIRSIRRRTEIRRESQRDNLRKLTRGTSFHNLLTIVLAKEKPISTRTRDSRRRSESTSLSPPPPDLLSRLSTPSDDDIPVPRLSMGHDPLAPTRTLTRTPPARDDDTLQSIEGARRAPLARLSDRLSFGADEVEDTMMNILANRPDPAPFGDDSVDFGDQGFQMGEYIPRHNSADTSDDTVDLRNMEIEEGGDYTEALARESSPMMELEPPAIIKQRKPLKQQKSPESILF
jgi:hypothetical protein